MSTPEVFRMEGVVARYPDENAGFGFIKPTGEFEGAPNIFFHHTAIREGIKLKEGDKVSFALSPAPESSKKQDDVAVDIDTI